jgi:hypothetical protein
LEDLEIDYRAPFLPYGKTFLLVEKLAFHLAQLYPFQFA